MYLYIQDNHRPKTKFVYWNLLVYNFLVDNSNKTLKIKISNRSLVINHHVWGSWLNGLDLKKISTVFRDPADDYVFGSWEKKRKVIRFYTPILNNETNQTTRKPAMPDNMYAYIA